VKSKNKNTFGSHLLMFLGHNFSSVFGFQKAMSEICFSCIILISVLHFCFSLVVHFSFIRSLFCHMLHPCQIRVVRVLLGVFSNFAYVALVFIAS
jgi:hypothetical protein